MTERTSTPWDIRPTGTGFYRVWDADDLVVSAILARADANLIAAAPDLKAALVELVNLLDGTDYRDGSAVWQARAAIAKAEGRDG